jgi:predicted short-subunit dehydrogenase-like oxidoreductase (DUF2520 family)
VGRGRVGRALARSLSESGLRVTVLSRPLKRGARPGGPFAAVFFAVPDRAISRAAAAARRAGLCAGCAFHLSGALPAQALRPLGVPSASFHPLRSFAGKPSERLAGCTVALEGDERAVRIGLRLARRLGARPWRITAAAKPLYHAAATLAAFGTGAVIAAARRAAVQAGMPGNLALSALAQLAQEAAENLEARGIPGGLTGPAVRGDRATVKLHRRALAGFPELSRMYDAAVGLLRSGRGDRRGSRP